MPKLLSKDQTPDNLRPYIFHGVDLSWRNGDKDATGDCPFCDDEEQRFGVALKTGVANCFVCSATGNAQTFIERVWEESGSTTSNYQPLAEDRKLLYPETLTFWQVVFSVYTDDWLVPGYTLDRKLGQLYRYTNTKKGKRLLPTPTLGHKIFGLNLYDAEKNSVYLCEGPWDAMALWEVLQHTKETNDGLAQTANPKMSLLADANVLAVPGANVFFPSWVKWFAGKDVFLCFDNDHNRIHPKTKKTIVGAGPAGMERVTKILSEAAEPPASINYLQWSPEGYDKNLPSGTDVRDFLTTL